MERPHIFTKGEPYQYELSMESLERLVVAVIQLETVDGRRVALRAENVLQYWVWSQLPAPVINPELPGT